MICFFENWCNLCWLDSAFENLTRDVTFHFISFKSISLEVIVQFITKCGKEGKKTHLLLINRKMMKRNPLHDKLIKGLFHDIPYDFFQSANQAPNVD